MKTKQTHDEAAYERYVRFCAGIGAEPAEFEAWAKNTQRISAVSWLGCWPGHANMSQGKKFDSAVMTEFAAA